MRKLCALLSCVGLVMFPAMMRAVPRGHGDEADRIFQPSIAITDFPGDDKALGHFLADTLLTDLSHSERVQTLERTELHQAMADLDIGESGPLTPGQVRHLGNLIHATRFVVGSFLVHDDQVVINVRLLDTQTGLNVPGSSFNVAGPRRDLLTVTHRIARQLHRKLTGEDLVIDEEGHDSAPSPSIPEVKERDHEPSPFLPEEPDPLESGKNLGLIPQNAHPGTPLLDRDLAGFIGRLARRVTTENVLHLGQTGGPVTRMQALTAVAKLIISNADMPAFRSPSVNALTPDGALIPLWGQPYLAAAIDQGWWDAGTPFRPRVAATWAFMQQIASKLPIEADPPRSVPRHEEAPVVNEVFTGLVIDARDFHVQRDRSPRVVDEDGRDVYPDPKHCPTPDYVEEHGMVGYATADNDSRRSGSHPLVVRAVGSTGPGPFDVVVSNEDAQRILEANRRSKFLWKWNVTLLVGEH